MAEEEPAERFDVIVLGAGIFGAALSYYLAAENHRRVVALDVAESIRGPSGSTTSAGILSVQGWDPWDLAIVRETVAEYARLADAEGTAPLRRNGGLRVARTDEGVRWLSRLESMLSSEGVEVHPLRTGDLSDRLPFADLSDVRAGLLTPDDSVVDSGDLLAGYLRAARRAGAEVRSLELPVDRAIERDGRWHVGGPTPVAADSLVVAAGAGSKRLLSALGASLPLAPFRAQVVQLRPGPLQAEFPTLHDLDLNLYARPAPLGRIVVGDGTGTQEEDPLRWRTEADAEFVNRTTVAGAELFAGLSSIRVERAGAGLCVASPDRYPLVGPAPGAPHLFVAAGFNGLGTMRAGGLARRLARAIVSGEWNDLAPASPARFVGPSAPFEPRPEFPLEADPDVPLPRRVAPLPEVSVRTDADDVLARRLERVSEVDHLRWSPLSEWFDPFLPLFARDAIRTGGTVEVMEEGDTVRGLLLAGTSEGVASGFTRQRRVADRFLDRADAGGIYLEDAWRPGGAPVELFAADLRDWVAREPMRNPVRIARTDDLSGIRSLMRAELGPGVDPWIDSLPRPEETGFVCEVDRRVVGISWLSRVGAFARGHSFVVHPRFRGLGIGTDLLTARMLWLHQTGGRLVVSEIYDGNVASRTAAERAGMTFVARMYHFPGRRGGIEGSVTSAAPRTADRPSRSNP
jgi:glycine/D-amino acid oxidase-like deaminating enzyme/RimJ/RimL family protein N-acetyltransferase